MWRLDSNIDSKSSYNTFLNPEDLVDLIKVWLENRSFYVSINGANSLMFDVLHGTVQGSVLGPVLYAIFVSPIFDLEDKLTDSD